MARFISSTKPLLQDWERRLWHVLLRNHQSSKMKKQKTMFQVKGQDKTSGKNLNEAEVSNLPDRVQVMVIKTLSGQGRRMDEYSENLNKDGKYKKVSNRSRRAGKVQQETRGSSRRRQRSPRQSRGTHPVTVATRKREKWRWLKGLVGQHQTHWHSHCRAPERERDMEQKYYLKK